LDSLKPQPKPKGLVKKVGKRLKFRANRDAAEMERINNFLIDQIHKDRLKIDRKTVDQIMTQFDQVVYTSEVNNANMGIGLEASKEATETNKKRIEEIFQKNNLDEKASKAVLDSLRLIMSAVIQAKVIENGVDEREISARIDSTIKEIRIVKHSASSKISPIEIDTTKGKTSYFKRSLVPKIEIIAWYNSDLENKYFNYNYNYLSAINLDSYKLSATGTCKNPGEIREFQKKGGVIAYSQSKSCDVHLTIYNNNQEEVRDFLRSSVAQKIFFRELDSLISKSKLRGVNIYFDCPMSPEPFVRFITLLRQNLNTFHPEIQLNITIPPVVNNENVDKIASYSFEKLKTMVNYFLVSTDHLIPQDVVYAQASSPLKISDKFPNRTIESTFNYYTQYILPSQFVMTLAYSGTVWDVNDFSGLQPASLTDSIGYSEIQDFYLNRQNEDQNIVKGFDPDQAATFLNVIRPNSDNLEQVWFEDSRSLYLKYQWALKKEIGGVTIKGLGNDDHYPELWNALGASLIRIDTTQMDDPNIKVGRMTRLWTIMTNAYKGFERKTFWRDLQWAHAVRLKYSTSDTIIGYRRFDYNLNKSIGSVDDSITKYLVKEKIWKETAPYVEEKKNNNECYLPALSFCYSLYARWTIYAKFFNWCFYLLFALTLIFAIISFQLERYLLGGEKTRKFIRNLPSILGFTSILFFCFWMFIDPSIKWFGTGSKGGTESILMIYILIFGITFGWFIAYNYYKYKRL
jgi:spore germination protein YaaH